MQKRLIVLAIAVLSLVAIGCPPKGEGGAATATDGKILVGEYGSFSGTEATFGKSTHEGITMAIDEINAGGGVNGRKIKVFTEDTQSKAEEAANTVTKLISQNNVVAVLGEVASSSSMAAAPVCQSNKVPMISPSSTNPSVTEKGDYIFRMCFIDPYQGEAMANYVTRTLGVKTAAILTDVRSDYSTGLAKFFKATFVKNGGRIVGEQSYAKGDSDFRAQLTSIKPSKPQIIFVPGYYNDIGQIAIQAKDLGINAPLVGGDGWESPKLIEIGGKALEGSFFTTHYHQDDPSDAVRNFVQKYEQRFKYKPDALAALGYDAARLLADAMTRAGTTDGPAVRDALAQTKNFAGVTGVITFGPDRNPIGKKLVVLEVRNGKLALKASVDPVAQAAASAPPAATATSGATATATTAATGS
ncbi:MAG: ABC transporter substrate-binding protein [Thermoanaerobaculia bacterium]|nr:ABC transporter substrate-binding protein [Thermoanaerobaculia bacterium]